MEGIPEFWPGNLGEAGQSPKRLSQFVPHSGTCVFTLCSAFPFDYYYSKHTMSTSLVMLLCLWVCCQGVQRSWAIRKALYLPWLKRKQVIRQKRCRGIALVPSSTSVSLSLRLIVLVSYFELSPTHPVKLISLLSDCAFVWMHVCVRMSSLCSVLNRPKMCHQTWRDFHNDSSLFGIVWSSCDDHCSPGYFIVWGHSNSWVRICIFCHNIRCEIDGKWEREREVERNEYVHRYNLILYYLSQWLVPIIEKCPL